MGLRHSFYRALFALTPGESSSIDEIAEKLGVLPSTAKRYLKELVKLGYVTEGFEGKFSLTETGELLRKSVLSHLKSHRDLSPYFFTDPSTSQPVPLSIKNLRQLYALLKYDVIEWKILEHHVKAGYLSKWIREAIGDIELANKIDEARNSIDKDKLMKIIEERLKIIDSIKGLQVS